MRIRCCLMTACLVAMLAACKGGDKPNISSGKMEELLYDYTLADGICQEQHPGDSAFLKAYREAIFKKHDVTEAEFDSSLKWYMRHPDEMYDIYDAISKKIEEKQEALTGEHHGGFYEEVYATTGDTANIWKDSPYLVLSNVAGKNLYRFSIPVDTAFHMYDKFEWRLTATYLDKRGEHRPLVMGLKGKFTNDSIVGATRTIYSNSAAVLTLNCDSAYTMKQMDGFILLPGNTKDFSADVLLTRIILLRYHRKEEDLPQNRFKKLQEEKPKTEAKDTAVSAVPVSVGSIPKGVIPNVKPMDRPIPIKEQIKEAKN